MTGHLPDYKLVTAVPVVVLDDEHKPNSLPAKELSRNSSNSNINTTSNSNSNDVSNSNSNASSSTSLASTTRNGKSGS